MIYWKLIEKFKGAFFNTIGSVVKCFAVRPDLFAVAILGQTFCGISSIFFLSIPAKLSAVWFGNNQISLATAVDIFLGIKLGVLFKATILLRLGHREDRLE